MASVDEVFRQMQTFAEGEETIDSNNYCMLESDTTRKILIPEKYSIFGVESDEKSNRIKFKFPQHVNDIDLSELSLRINYRNANGEIDQNLTENKETTDDRFVTFEWVLTRKVTAYMGDVDFIVCAIKTQPDGTLINEWNTTIATVQTLEGLEPEPVTEEETEQARDLLTQLLSVMLSVKTDSVQAVNDTKDNAITEITQTKTQAISDIQAEGQTQTEAVDAKGAQVLESIPDDYTTLEKCVDELEKNRAYVIVGNGSGEFVTLNDSSELKTRNIKLFGKSVQAETTGAQLFNVNVCKNETDLQYKITIDDYATGKITVSMDNPSGTVVMPVNRLSDYCPTMTAGKTYYLSGKRDGSSNGNISLVDVSDTWDFGTSREITEQDLQSAVNFGFGTYSNIMIVEGSSEKPYEVYTGGQAATEPSPDYPLPITSAGNYDEESEKYEVGIGVTGKNLFDASKIPTKSQGGATVTNNGDGSFTISGSGNLSEIFGVSYSISHSNMMKFFKVGTVKMYTEKTTHPYFYVNLHKDKKHFITLVSSSKSSTGQFEMKKEYFEDEAYYLSFGINGNVNGTIVPGTIKPILYQEGDSTWEPFKRQLISLQLPNLLRGIPVDSGGNYTDAEGQQWLCDYIDRERGKYVQCVQEIVFDGVTSGRKVNGTDGYYSNATHAYIKEVSHINFSNLIADKLKQIISSDYTREGIISSVVISIRLFNTRTGVNKEDDNAQIINKFNDVLKQWYDEGNPLVVYYQLANLIETDLTPDQIAALNLSTYQGITNIGTDTMPQVGVDVEYIADTKTYIDNAIAEAIAAIPTE